MPEKEVTTKNQVIVAIALANSVYGRLRDEEYKGAQLFCRPGRKIYPSTILNSIPRTEALIEAARQALVENIAPDNPESIENHAKRITVLQGRFDLEGGKVWPLKKVAKKLRILPIRARQFEQEIRDYAYKTNSPAWTTLKELFINYSR